MKENKLIFKKVFFSKIAIFGIFLSFIIGVILYFFGIIKSNTDIKDNFFQKTNNYIYKINNKKENIETILSSTNLFISLISNLNLKNFHSYYYELNKQNIIQTTALGYSIWVNHKNKEFIYQKMLTDYEKNYKDNPILLKKILNAIEKNKEKNNHKGYFIIYDIEPINLYYNKIGAEESQELSKDILMVRNKKYINRKNNIYRLNMMINLPSFFKEIVEKQDTNIHVDYSINKKFNEKKINDKIYEKNYLLSFDNNKIYIHFKENFKKEIIPIENKLIIDSFFVALSFYVLWLFLITLLTFQNKVNSVAQKMNEELNRIAWYDNLTSLYNRAYLLKLIRLKIEAKKYKFAILFIDLDGFKKINDTLGHEAGDQVLRDYAKKLKNNFKNDSNIDLGRVGGDEFIVLIEYENEELILFLNSAISKIIEATQQPFYVKNNKFKISQSIGISLYPEHANTEEELLRKSDLAMYHNKKDKMSNYVLYSKELENDLVEKTEIESELMGALEKNEMFLVLLPKMKILNNKEVVVSGFEILLRWKNDKKDYISPEKFIKIAEENGFIYELTYWMIEKTCQLIKELKEEDYKLNFSINLSAQQFLNEELAFNIIKIILKNNISPKNIIFEITERILMKNPDLSVSIMNQFIEKGFQFSIDDFGIGYSSLSYLTQLPVSELKIDKSFIWSAKNNKNSIAVIKTIIAMGHQLRLKVVAEGVENQEQFNFLRQQDCDEYQGFYFSKPINCQEFKEFLKNNKIERNKSLLELIKK